MSNTKHYVAKVHDLI